MKKTPRISETEWEVMKVLWARSPLNAAGIIDVLLKSDPTWHPKTARTLLNRLVKKGAVAFEKGARGYLYRSKVRESDCVGAESESFLARIFGGSLQPMLAHFVEHRKIPAAEMRELKRLLGKK